MMIRLDRVFWGTLLLVAATAGHADAQSASDGDAEISTLKQQLRMMEQKLDKLQKQTAANTTAAANANAKVDAKVNVASTNGNLPIKNPVAPSDVVVKMPNNRPTICTADNQNCISVTSRVHWVTTIIPTPRRLRRRSSMTAKTCAARGSA
jgi:phosphate-selective porin OprO and OprP